MKTPKFVSQSRLSERHANRPVILRLAWSNSFSFEKKIAANSGRIKKIGVRSSRFAMQ
jgi:hypothetical protein